MYEIQIDKLNDDSSLFGIRLIEFYLKIYAAWLKKEQILAWALLEIQMINNNNNSFEIEFMAFIDIEH